MICACESNGGGYYDNVTQIIFSFDELEIKVVRNKIT